MSETKEPIEIPEMVMYCAVLCGNCLGELVIEPQKGLPVKEERHEY